MLRAALYMMAFLVAQVIAIEPFPPGYVQTELTRTFEPFNNGTTVNLTGHAQKVLQNLYQISPTHYHEIMTKAPTAPAISKSKAELRSEFGPVCGRTPGVNKAALLMAINTGIKYLRPIPGQPTMRPGPRACGRGSCSDDSAIWWCNDKTEWASLPAFNTIADCAQVQA